ncbi:hypothetical protein NFI96_029989, partial [Prochilodus magdalenae]
RPKPTVKVQPAHHVFIGETVTLTCDIEGGGDWQYQWSKDNKALSEAQWKKKYNTFTAEESHKGVYTCIGTQSTERCCYSQTSDAVTLTVSEKPKPTMRVDPQRSVYTGDTVTLTCQVGQSTGWSFVWYKGSQSLESQYPADKDPNTISVTVSDVGTAEFTCAAHRGTYSTQRSDPVRITVTARPKPTVRVHPAVHVFIGETVILTCDIEGGGDWQYQWSKDNKALSDAQWKKKYTFTAEESHKRVYTCNGTQSTEPSYSQTSDVVRLTVSVKPKPTVRVYPQSSLYPGDTVTLTCEVGQSTGWSFLWYKGSQSLQSQYPADRDPNTISVTVPDVGTVGFTCEAHRGTYRTHRSARVRITVTERPKATVKVHPAGHVLTGERVTLTCDIESGGGWQYQWYKDNTALRPAQTGSTYTISRVDQSDKGVYTCRGTQSTETCCYSQTSDAVTLTVSDKPTVTVRVTSQSSVYTGDTVTLTCEVEQSAGWSFAWYKDSIMLSQSQYPADKNPNTISVTVSDVGTPEFTCEAYRQEYFTYHRYRSYPQYYPPYHPYYYTEKSGPAVVTVEERPKSTVRVQPARHVFIGETVTLTCDIEGGAGWQYQWYKDNNYLSAAQWKKEYNTFTAEESHKGVYTCKGTQSTERCCYSQTSEAVRLTVSVRPKATVKVHPAGHVLTGERVTLTCGIESGGGWQYQWYKDDTALRPAQTGNTYTIDKVAQSDEGVYTCRGTQSTETCCYSQTSDAVTLTVSGESPPVSLMVTPSRTQHFTSGSLSLNCKGRINSTGWKVSRKVSDCSSGWGSVTGSTCNISSLNTSHTGVYWCESESGGRSNPVNITVHSGSVILESPVHPVPEGDPLTLYCLYRHTNSSNLTAEFYKDRSLLQTQTTGEMIIRTVSKSDEGLYHCKHPERGESPQSWISVR